ncbi:MAG: ATP-binding protein [Actinomycetota bacterium]
MDTAVVAVVAGALLLGVGLGAWLRGATMGRRLRRMTEAITRLGKGEPEIRTNEGGPAEVAELATAVNRAADRLGKQLPALRREQHVRDLILSSMQEGVLLVDGDGGIVFANEAMDEHLRTRTESLNQLHPPAFREAIELAAQTRSPLSVEAEMTAPNAWLRGTAVPAAEGSAVLLVVRDVTEAKRLDSVRRDFVANASHELKTPAASIQATAETIRLAAADDPAVIPRFAEQLDREALRLSRIVADLLDLSRLETGSDIDEDVRLDTLLHEEGARLREAAASAQVELELDATPVPPIRGSGRDLALCIRNLVDNAIRYTKPGGRVEVAVVEGATGDVVVRVSDTGVGIPSRDLPRIFERFYRVDRARSRQSGGTGLGLSIARHVIENHRGEIAVESELGVGTRFEIRFPPVPPKPAGDPFTHDREGPAAKGESFPGSDPSGAGQISSPAGRSSNN